VNGSNFDIARFIPFQIKKTAVIEYLHRNVGHTLTTKTEQNRTIAAGHRQK
jgi:hypothetical protein